MKKLKITLMSAAVSFACSQSAICAYLVGSVDPGSPADMAEEIDYLQTLSEMGLGAVKFEPMPGNKERTFTTSDTYDTPTLQLADIVDYLKFDPPSETATITGYQFVLGKFGSTSWIWELAAGEEFVIPQTYSNDTYKGGGLSHYSVFNATTTSVPDGGTSIALLGMALLGLGGVRKFFGKA